MTANSEIPYEAPPDDARLVAQLRAGDEQAFTALVEQYHGAMIRLAMIYVPDRAAAEEVVQETWLGVLNGLSRFEGRSSLKTWMFTILTNRAKTRGQREGRYVPLSTILDERDTAELPVPADRFQSEGEWAAPVASWENLPEDRLLSDEVRGLIRQAVADLPSNQREVITLRDLDGLSSKEVCSILGLTETNQRVLLHRARAKVHLVLERYLQES